MASFDITFETEEELAATFEATVQTPAEEETVTITVYNTMGSAQDLYYPPNATWTGFEPDEETGAVYGTLTIPTQSMIAIRGQMVMSISVSSGSGMSFEKLPIEGRIIGTSVYVVYIGDADGIIGIG